MLRHRNWKYERKTKRYLSTLRLTQREYQSYLYILQSRELELSQLMRELLTHYLACPNHSPEIQAVINAAKDLYKD